ncbi:glycosyltransferase family 4 protein [Formosa sp. S-31]|uniref:glycosyltransferase family 4 protein n=1 Tax=Formosa sp. S-31 TaxID=2790949 RepID=UPI003EBCDB15
MPERDVLIITSYYPPEIGAASNRIYHLAHGLKNKGFKVAVATPLPNYPTGKIFKAYKGQLKNTSTEQGVKIYRLWIYACNSKNKLLRLFAMLSYSFSLIWFFIFCKIPKTVIVQSPPLLVAFTCMLFLKSKHRNLILNVSDLWPIAGLELGALTKNLNYKILEHIETFNYKRADLILGQSKEIIKHVKSIAPNKSTLLYRNYPIIEHSIPNLKNNKSEKIKMVYAGLLGIAQGIFKLCETLDYSNIEFHIYGAGAEQSKIEDFIKRHPQLPITFHGELCRHELHKALYKYDITIIPLLNRIYGSVPSKIFEYAKLGLPMLYFGGGEGEDIIKQHHLGWVVEAGNYSQLNQTINSLSHKDFTSELNTAISETARIHFNLNTQLDILTEKLKT